MKRSLILLGVLLVLSGCSQENLAGGATDIGDDFTVQDANVIPPLRTVDSSSLIDPYQFEVQFDVDAVYGQAYFSAGGSDWQPVDVLASRMFHEATSDSVWSTGTVREVLEVLPSDLPSGDSTAYLAVYVCDYENEAWDCRGNDWSIVPIELTKEEIVCADGCYASHACYSQGERNPSQYSRVCEEDEWIEQDLTPLVITTDEVTASYPFYDDGQAAIEDIDLGSQTLQPSGVEATESLRLYLPAFTKDNDEINGTGYDNAERIFDYVVSFSPALEFEHNNRFPSWFNITEQILIPFMNAEYQVIDGDYEDGGGYLLLVDNTNSFELTTGQSILLERYALSEEYSFELTNLAVGWSGYPEYSAVRYLLNGETLDTTQQYDSEYLQAHFALTPLRFTEVPRENVGPNPVSVRTSLGSGEWELWHQGAAEVGREDLDDTAVQLNWTKVNQTTYLNSIKYTVESDDDYVWQPNTLISEVIDQSAAVNPLYFNINLVNWTLDNSTNSTNTTFQILRMDQPHYS